MWSGVVVLLLLTVCVVWLRRESGSEGGLDESQRTYPGSPIHLRRTEELIGRIGSESQERLIDNLLDDDQLYFEPSVKGGIGEQTDLERCLSSRRTLRLWQVLSELPEAERVSVLRRLSERVRADHRASTDWMMKTAIDPSVPQERPAHLKSLLATKMALCACWWMTVDFEGLAPLLNDMAPTEAYAREVEEELAGDPRYEHLEFFFDTHLQPDNACKLNLLLLAIQRQAGAASAQVDALREKLKQHGLPMKRFALTAWDAKVGTFDIVHVYEGVPIDRTKGVREIDLYAWGEHRFDREFQEGVLEEVKRVADDVVSTSN